MKKLDKPKRKTVAKLKKDAWVLFSKYIRLRDCLRTTGCSSFGLCITCGKRYHFKLLQAGHFVPGHLGLNYFNERGVHAQCFHCNMHLKGNTLEYRRQIIKLYGEGADEEIEIEARQIKQFKPLELEEFIERLKAKIKAVEATGYDAFKAELLRNPQIHREYEALKPKYGRIARGFKQE